MISPKIWRLGFDVLTFVETKINNMNQQQRVRHRKANPVEHVCKVITSCQNQTQLNAAEKYACLAGLRIDPIVNEALTTMKQIFKAI